MKKITLTSNDGIISFDATLSDNYTRIIEDYGNEAKSILNHGSRGIDGEWGLKFYGKKGNVCFNFECTEHGRRTINAKSGFHIVDGREEEFYFKVHNRESVKVITEISHHCPEHISTMNDNNIDELHK